MTPVEASIQSPQSCQACIMVHPLEMHEVQPDQSGVLDAPSRSAVKPAVFKIVNQVLGTMAGTESKESAPDSPQEKNPQTQNYLAMARDVLLLSVPLAYTLGFLSWSVYAYKSGLGFLVLPIPRYLVAGYALAIFIAAILGPWWFFARRGFNRRQVILSLVTSLALLLAINIVGAELGIFQISWRLILYPFVVGALAIVWTTLRANAKGSDVQPNYIEHASEPVAAVLFTMLIMGGVFLLPAIPSEFGGADSPTAIFDLDTSRLTPVLSVTVVNWSVSNISEPTVRSVELSVLAETPEGFLVRTLERSTGRDPLYGIPRDSVWTITWT